MFMKIDDLDIFMSKRGLGERSKTNKAAEPTYQGSD